MARVIPFQDHALARLRERLGEAQEANEDLIAFARGHSGAVSAIHAAVLAAIERVGTISRMLLPTDGLWRGAIDGETARAITGIFTEHQAGRMLDARPSGIKIRGRKSTRAFLKTAVPRELIARILTTAGRAPSGSNIQPWKVYVVDGTARDELAADLCHRYDTVGEGEREYEYYPVKWREPYLARRRACGWGLYGTMGITREDKAGMHAQRRQNYEFFGAPTAFIFTIDRELEQGSWLDTGMFIQSIMIAARQFGLETS